MELVTKIIDPLNNFWVEDYNEEAKKFFIDLGFKDIKYGGFVPTYKLEFKGSGTFGLWSKEEKDRIFTALDSIDKSELDWDGDINEMNPYD